jgi:hypothetical protein
MWAGPSFIGGDTAVKEITKTARARDTEDHPETGACSRLYFVSKLASA